MKEKIELKEGYEFLNVFLKQNIKCEYIDCRPLFTGYLVDDIILVVLRKEDIIISPNHHYFSSSKDVIDKNKRLTSKDVAEIIKKEREEIRYGR